MAVVTVTSTLPAAEAAGATAVICVAELTVNELAATPPNETPAAPLKLLPVMVTLVPPARPPLLGLRLVTVGEGLDAATPNAWTSVAASNHESLPLNEWTWPTTRTPSTDSAGPVNVYVTPAAAGTLYG